MEITLHECYRCKKRRKILWLKKSYEDSFYCTCSSRKMRHRFDASYEDYFVSLIRGPITVEGLVGLAQSEYMCVDSATLKIKLKVFDLDHLSEPEFWKVVNIVLSSDDLYRFRKLLVQVTDKEQMLKLIANVNPRIGIPQLRAYLLPKKLPLSVDEVSWMETVIETDFYHPEIDYISDWQELPSVVECFSSRLSYDLQKGA